MRWNTSAWNWRLKRKNHGNTSSRIYLLDLVDVWLPLILFGIARVESLNPDETYMLAVSPTESLNPDETYMQSVSATEMSDRL